MLAICSAKGIAVATAAVVIVPAFQRHPAHGDKQRRVEDEQGRPHQRENAHQLVECVGVLDHRLRDIFVFMLAGRECLERQDIGVAVDHAAAHLRPPLRQLGRALCDPGHRGPEDQAIEHQPDRHDRQQKRVEPGQHHDGDRDEHQRIPDGIDGEIDAHLHRIAALHDLGPDAAGKVVLEERPVLAHDMPVALPADEVDEVRRDGMVADQRIDDHRQRTQKHDEGHQDEQRPMRGEEIAGPGAGALRR
nr:hypothetical protein [Mesorhizobium sp.]